MLSRIKQISSLGQAIWLDFISRELLRSGQLQALIDEGITGLTSNPTIFQKAVASGKDYDDLIERGARQEWTATQTFEAIALRDVGDAADLMRPVYNETHGRDGFVSIEVNPQLAHDTDGTIAEARRLHGALRRPNVMIKVPATDEGLPAIRTLIGEGINVNITLIFGLEMYERVIQAYLDGLRIFHNAGGKLPTVSSVASFFVSRVDTLVDKQLQARIDQGEDLEHLLGKAAIANAALAYKKYKSVFEGEAFADWRQLGARVQRPLWASTSTKNPAYPPTKYIDPLIGVNTVNTVPLETLTAIREHAQVAQSIESGIESARQTMALLEEADVDMRAVTDQLLRDGVQSFADSYVKLIADIERKREKFAQMA